MRRPSATGFRDMATRLGCTTAEVLALTILALGSMGMMGMLWLLQRGAETPADRSIAVAVPDESAPSDPAASDVPSSAARSPTPTLPTTVRVHVAGRVVAAGVYELDARARVVDALTAAGGPTAEADLEAVNLAQPLSDGLQIRVPAPGESLPAPLPGVASGIATAAGGSVVELNTADATALETLPGVGPVTAQRILEYRARVGGFHSVDELLDVPGIGEATLSGMADRVTVRR